MQPMLVGGPSCGGEGSRMYDSSWQGLCLLILRRVFSSCPKVCAMSGKFSVSLTQYTQNRSFFSVAKNRTSPGVMQS